MEDRLVGLLPFPATTTIDYKKQRISFSYLDKESLACWWKVFLYLTASYIIIFLFPLLAVLGYMAWPTPKRIFTPIELVGVILFFSIVLPAITAFLHLYTPAGKHMKKVLPKLYELFTPMHKYWKSFTKAQGKTIVIPMEECLVLEWTAEGDFKDYLEKVDIVDWEYYSGDTTENKHVWLFAIFRYSQKPEKGELVVSWY